MAKITFLLLFLVLNSQVNLLQAQLRQTNHYNLQPDVKLLTGAENTAQWLPLIKGKKVGVVANQTSILIQHDMDNVEQVHLVDYMRFKNVHITTIFSPEHGFRGTADAGELIKDGKDQKTGLPIISLYGDHKKPTAEQMRNLDVLVFDLQDVGVRFYTYISTLHYVMEACADSQIPLIILDRPNPNGTRIDGPVLETAYSSFVGMHPVPVLHGLTIGEYGNMINGQGWLANKMKCALTIIPCLGYKKTMSYTLPVKPSPNLPNAKAINLYASLCLFEGTDVSVGRGTQKQFQIYGSPNLPSTQFSFIPVPNDGAKNPIHNGKICFGKDLSATADVYNLEIKWLIECYQTTTDKSSFFNDFFIKLAGTKSLRVQIEAGLPEAQIRKSWEPGLASYRKMKKRYELY